MDPVLEFIRTIDPILSGTLGFLIGTLAGHHIALARDKRSEFNAAVAPIRAQLIKDIEDTRWWVKIPSAVELDSFEHLMWPWRRRSLRAAIKRYAQQHQTQEKIASAAGDRAYADADAVRNAAKEVLALLSHR